MLKVAYQGEAGAFSEQAALQFFSAQDVSIQFQPCPTFEKMVSALNNDLVDRAILPIQNSLAGTIHHNLDLLLRYKNLTIIGELDFQVRHCLLALPGVKMADIKVVRSHFVALHQCTAYLKRKGLKSEVAYDTAGSAKSIQQQQAKDCAAIASLRAANVYNLNVLEAGIQDDPCNYTRFLILSKHKYEYIPGVPCRTSLVFSLENGPGVLHQALSVFAVTKIDLTKIESRHLHTVRAALQESDEIFSDSSVEERWRYVFYIDIGRHADETPVAKALSYLQEITSFYRVLGSYPSSS